VVERKGRVEGKVALVTGVAKADSIGYATARVLGQEGALLAIVDISEKVHDCAWQLREEGFTVSSHTTADLTKMAQVQAAVDEALTCYGRIDVLVNNAGMVVYGQEEDFTAFQDLTEESWDFGIAINLKTQFNVTRCIVPGMIERGYGRIVNVSSVTGPVVANPEEAAYCAAKAGVLGLTRGLALDVAKHGITVNAVGPGWIATGSQAEGEDVGGLNTPMGRSAYPEEVARVICFLGSDDASYITGQLVVVDGGNTIQEYKGPSELYY
jgi:3-oxoacyl-[acyl-carrier protein] reductase